MSPLTDLSFQGIAERDAGQPFNFDVQQADIYGRLCPRLLAARLLRVKIELEDLQIETTFDAACNGIVEPELWLGCL
ncbi:hypothetical protein HNQ60_003882 [Povalibacter uvarum]|uniref:Uncharacterized protein n=1 Tax=Povalibacter uvarum TaxID=732238 RepID=A0A841HT11_9GAMM|nr:hypothetical protein [Povalibacter uvarum]MBB6094995.1 hypothetical protein [Povalibacter uvarum]